MNKMLKNDNIVIVPGVRDNLKCVTVQCKLYTEKDSCYLLFSVIVNENYIILARFYSVKRLSALHN